jgi:hypothetical protein
VIDGNAIEVPEEVCKIKVLLAPYFKHTVLYCLQKKGSNAVFTGIQDSETQPAQR